MRMSRLTLLAFFGIATGVKAGSLPPADEKMAMDISKKSAVFYTPGVAVANWNRDGIDIIRLLARSPGGTAKNAVLYIDSESGKKSLTLYDSVIEQGDIPDDWTLVMEHGVRPTDAPGNIVTMSRLSGPYVLVELLGYTRKGSAFCADAIGAYQVYRVAGQPVTKLLERGIKISVRATEIAAANKRICEVFVERGGQLASDLFTEDGFTLPSFKKLIDDKISIIRRDHLDDVLGF